MFLFRHKYHIILICALLFLSRIVPAQTLPSLPTDPNIRKGTLGCGVTYYMVTEPSQKGYAQLAVVQRDEPLSEAAREGLRGRFFARMGIAQNPPDILIDLPFDSFHGVYGYTHAKEIAEIGRQLTTDALDRYEASPAPSNGND